MQFSLDFTENMCYRAHVHYMGRRPGGFSSGIDYRGIDYRGIDYRGIDYRGIDYRGIDSPIMDRPAMGRNSTKQSFYDTA